MYVGGFVFVILDKRRCLRLCMMNRWENIHRRYQYPQKHHKVYRGHLQQYDMYQDRVAPGIHVKIVWILRYEKSKVSRTRKFRRRSSMRFTQSVFRRLSASLCSVRFPRDLCDLFRTSSISSFIVNKHLREEGPLATTKQQCRQLSRVQ